MPQENVGIALGLVIGAGAATSLGAMVVFFPTLVKFASRKTLAGALGLSAGVMTYVSFVEIFSKSNGSFEDAGFSEDRAYLYATLCFFAGVVLMLLLNAAVRLLLKGDHHHHHQAQFPPDNDAQRPTDSVSHESGAASREQQLSDDDDQVGITFSGGAGVEVEPEELENMAKDVQDENEQQESGKLMRMSVNTALAIALHNFPEGLATFVATLNDPKVGLVLAVAIAIHNVPEGLCVAMPIFYATGNRWKAFWWGVLSGVSEPVAAFLGWAILANNFSDTLYAILFGIVSGMMVIISVRELLPTAHRYDPDDTIVTLSFIAGMVIMALSLALFVI